MNITKEMQDRVVGKQVAFTYNDKRIVRTISEIMDVIHETWCGDLGFENPDNSHSDSFIIHGNTDEKNLPLMQGLVVQYDSEDGSRHGYISDVEEIKDLSHSDLEPDHVICNWCGTEMLVDQCADECPNCHHTGCLMDME